MPQKKGPFMKKILFCLLVSVTYLNSSPINPPTNNNILREQQIENYAENIIDTLFYNSVHSNDDKQAILRRIKKQLLTPTVVEKEYNLSVERTQQEVYQTILKTIIDHVARKSFDEAKKETGDYYITIKAQDRITRELMHIINETGEFSPGSLNNFVGKNLESKIKMTCYQFDRPNFQNIKRFDEKRCRICMQHFMPTLPWIYLRPCGHDMCTGCAHEYFIKNCKTRCPACNQPIDTHNLRLTLQVKA